ncbi:MAG TPA: alpha/beta fold hydrolase, partial [bacterium]
TGTPWVFEELAENLRRMGITASVPLLPGHGTRPEELIGISWQAWVEAVRAEIRRMHSSCECLFLLGLSVGGAIVLYLSSESPVNGVISLSAPIRFRGGWVRWLPLMKPFVRFWKKRRRPEFTEAGYDRYPLAALSEMLLFLKEAEKRLPQVTCPALILHSKGDRTVSSENAQLIFDSIRSASKRKVLLEHPFHSITKGEDKPLVHREVLAFIRANSRFEKEGAHGQNQC